MILVVWRLVKHLKINRQFIQHWERFLDIFSSYSANVLGFARQIDDDYLKKHPEICYNGEQNSYFIHKYPQIQHCVINLHYNEYIHPG